VNAKLAELDVVVAGGPELIVVSGGVVSGTVVSSTTTSSNNADGLPQSLTNDWTSSVKRADCVPAGAVRVPVTWCQAVSFAGTSLRKSPEAVPVQPAPG
jgi:hypothetical protein